MATSLDKLENKVHSSSARKALSYGEKIAKFGPVRPERYSTKYAEPQRENTTQFRLESSPPKLLDRSPPKFYTM